jgi:ABC-type transport system substrate-binding protein
VAQASGAFKMLAYVTSSAPDPVLELTSQYRTGGSRNYGRFSDAELDRSLDRAIVELNPTAREALLEEIQGKFIAAWLPMFVLYAQPARNLLQGNIGGYDTTAGTWYGFSSATKGGRWFYVDK